MRSSLLGGLLQNLKSNLNRKASRVRLFEFGRIFLKDNDVKDGPLSVAGVHQPVRISGLAYGDVFPEQWGVPNRKVDFFDVKADLQAVLHPLNIITQAGLDHPAFHPGRSAIIYHKNAKGTLEQIGVMGELHPKWQQEYGFTQAPILFELEWDAMDDIGLPHLKEPSKFQAVERDLAIVLKASIPAQEILDALKKASPSLVKEISLFDEFRPTPERLSGMHIDEKSLAFRVVLQDDTQTLQDSFVENAIKQLLDQVLIQFSARLR